MKKLIVTLFLTVINYGFSQTEELNNLSLDLDLQNQNTTKVNTALRVIKLLYESQDYTNALKFAKESELLSANLNYEEGLAKIYHLKGLIFFKERKVTKAIETLKSSKLIHEDLNNSLEVAKVDRDLGIIEIKQNNYEVGLDYIFNAIKIFEEKNDNDELIITYNNLQNTYSNLKLYNKAIVFALKKIAIQEQFKSTNELIKSNKELALLYKENTNYSESITFLHKALNYDKTNKKLREAICPILGDLYTKTRAYKVATKYLQESIKLNKASKNTKGIITSLRYLGEINLEKKHFKAANNQFMEIDELARDIDDTNAILKNYTFGITLDSVRGDFESAFIKQNDYYALKRKIAKQDQKIIDRKLASANSIDLPIIKTLYDKSFFAKINQDATLVSKNKFDRYKINLYISLIGFSILLAIIFVISYSKRNKGLKYTRDLELKNKNIELQKEAILKENKYFGNLNKSKDKLFSIISHDLRDSLTSTKGLIDLLKEGAITKDEFDALIPELSENANNASSLLFNLLNWSKSQMQSLESKPSSFNIQEVFKDKAKLIEQKLIAKNISLVNNITSELIFADRSMVEIVVQNILANAVKFCQSQDKITLFNTIKNGRSVISIADTGVGISKNNIDKLFLDNTFTTIGTHNEKGTGLGLTICKDLIELNDGRIWVNSLLGLGSKFFIELPLSKDQTNTIDLSNALAKRLPPTYNERYPLHKLQ